VTIQSELYLAAAIAAEHAGDTKKAELLFFAAADREYIATHSCESCR
jgi:hypothetical protein